MIFVTGLAQGGDEAGFAAGAVDYIVKPVSPAIVAARVRTQPSLVQATLLEQSYSDSIYMLAKPVITTTTTRASISGAHFAERDRSFRQSVTDTEMLHGWM